METPVADTNSEDRPQLRRVIIEQASSYALSILAHGLILAILLFLFPLLNSLGGGGGGGSGRGSGAISVSLVGAALGADSVGDDGVSLPGVEAGDETSIPTDGEQPVSEGDGLSIPSGDTAVEIGKTAQAGTETGGVEEKKQQAGASGLGGADDGGGVGTGKGAGIGSGEGTGIGSGKGGGVGNGIGDGVGDGVGRGALPAGAFSFQAGFDYCEKTDSNNGNVVRYTVEYTTGDEAPQIAFASSKFKPADITLSKIKKFISISFNSSVLTAERKTLFTGVVRCNCGSGECKLLTK